MDDVDEDKVIEMLVAFEKEMGENKGREKRRTWKENKERRQAQKKSRRILERGERPRLRTAPAAQIAAIADAGKPSARIHTARRRTGTKGSGVAGGAAKKADFFVYFGNVEGHDG